MNADEAMPEILLQSSLRAKFELVRLTKLISLIRSHPFNDARNHMAFYELRHEHVLRNLLRHRIYMCSLFKHPRTQTQTHIHTELLDYGSKRIASGFGQDILS